MDEKTQIKRSDTEQIAVGRRSNKLLPHIDIEKKGTATIEDVSVESTNTNLVEYAVIDIRYNLEATDKLVIPIHEGEPTDERLELIIDYADAGNLHELISETFPAFRREDGKWRVYIPTGVTSSVQHILFHSQMTEVLDNGLKLNGILPAFFYIFLIVISLLLFSPVVSFAINIILSIFLLSVEFKLPGKFI